MVVGMPGTEAEMEAQHIEGRVGLEVIQDEEKLLLERVEMALWPPGRDLLDFPPLEPFELDGVIGGDEGRGESVEFRAVHANEGLYDAVMLLVVQFCESIVGHGLIIFIKEKITYCTMVLNVDKALGTSLISKNDDFGQAIHFWLAQKLQFGEPAQKVRNSERIVKNGCERSELLFLRFCRL